MAEVVAIVAAIAGAIGSAAAAVSWTGVIVGAIVSAGLSFGAAALSGAFSRKSAFSAGADLGTGVKAAGQQIRISQSANDNHKVVYGEVRKSGTLVFTDEDSDDEDIHFYLAMAGHEIDSFRTFYLDNTTLSVSGNGVVTNNVYEGKNGATRVLIRGFKGKPEGDYQASTRRWPSHHKMQGLAFLWYRLEFDRDVFPNGVPHASALFRGKRLYDPRASRIDVTSEDAAGVITTASAHGRSAGDWIFVVSTDKAKWGEYRVSSVVDSTRLKLKTVKNESAKLGLTSDDQLSVMTWSNNWALCVLDYLIQGDDHGWGFGMNAGPGEIDEASFIAAANTSDETVDGAARYTCNGVIDTGDQPADIMEQLLTAGAGRLVYSNGKYYLFAGEYHSPTVTIDESWLNGGIQVQARPAKRDLFNAVRGQYIQIGSNNWQPGDFPPVTNAVYESQDGGERIYRDIELPFTTDSATAQRIAKIVLETGRQGIRASFRANMKALQLKCWDTVMLSFDELGWSSKVFRITRWEFNPEEGIYMEVQEEASASYDWNDGEATTEDPAPDTNLKRITDLDPPGVPSVSEEVYFAGAAAGHRIRAILTWAASPSLFVSHYEVQYKAATDTEWIPVETTIDTRAVVNDLATGKYDFRIKAINIRGVSSTWAIRSGVELFGETDQPADITGFQLAAINSQAHLSWEQAEDLDVRAGGRIELRWSAKTSGATWADGVRIGQALAGVATNAVVPLLNGTYMIKAVDSSGNYSATAASILATGVDLLDLNTVKTADQHTGFAGTKTSMYVESSDNTLRLDGADNHDSVSGLHDDAPGLYDFGGAVGFATSGEYLFDDGGNNFIDLEDVYSVRVTAGIQSLIVDAATLHDQAGGNHDDRLGLHDGNDLIDVVAEFWIRTTDDDPAGTPTWGDWQKFTVGEYRFRACQLKIVITSPSESYNIHISELTATLAVLDRPERHEDEAIGSSGTTITWDTPFHTRPKVLPIIQGHSAGDTWNVTHVTSGGKYTGATINVYNGGSGVARTVDVYAEGY